MSTTPEKNLTTWNYENFLEFHMPQLQSCAIPETLWPVLYYKLEKEVFDAGETFMIVKVEQTPDDGNCENYEGKISNWQVIVIAEDGIKKSDPNQIYLIDHAWTFRVDQMRTQLEEIPGLIERVASMMDIETAGKERQTLIEVVCKEIWKFSNTYSIGNASMGTEAAIPIWYIMDEFGSKIQHSDDPTCRMVPFVYIPTQMVYSLMFPLKDLDKNDYVTRDFAERISDPLERKACLLPWVTSDLRDVSFTQGNEEDDTFEKYKGDKIETLPSLDKNFPSLPIDRDINVYTTLPHVKQYLKDPRYSMVDNFDEADIVWIRDHFRDFKDLSENYPSKLINQFPCESIITVKDLLAIISQRASKKPTDPDTLETNPAWLPTTYNLKTELPKFISYFQHRDAKGLDNHWICKPWNLARGLDHHITDNLSHIVRLRETGPKIACKYIEDPVLFSREEIGPVKFDIRYVVLVTSVQPVTIHIHQQFLVRFANKSFTLDSFHDYEKHYTVMNYKKGVDIKEMKCEEFMNLFESQYHSTKWEDIEFKICKVIKELFTAATSLPPPQGIPHSPQSRAIYGLDFMLKWSTNDKGEKVMQPMLIEVNYGPDFSRHCEYYPKFLDDVFNVLFFGETENVPVVLIK